MIFKNIISALVFILFLYSAKSQVSIKKHFLEIATIDFPREPLKDKINGQIYFVLKEDSIVYFALMVDTKDNEKFNKKIDSIYDGFLRGFAKSIKGSIKKKQNYYVNKFRGVEATYSFINTDQTLWTAVTRVLLVEKMLFSYHFLTKSTESEALKTITKKFLDTFTLIRD